VKFLNSSKIIFIGYTIIALFLLVSISLFKSYDQQVEQSYLKHQESLLQAQILQRMQILGKNRSINLSQLIFEKDPFIQDEYIQNILTDGNFFGEARIRLYNTNLSPELKQIMSELDAQVVKNSFRQAQAIDLIQDDKFDDALKVYLNSLPYQNEILNQLAILAKDLKADSANTEREYEQIIAKDEALSACLHIALFLSIIALGIYSFRLAKSIEKQQEKEVETLSSQMTNQLHVNAMDAHILHAVDEYIVLVDKQGQFIRANPSLEDILTKDRFKHSLSIWHVLEQCSDDKINSEDVAQQVNNNGIWKQELELCTPFNCYALCEVTHFESTDIIDADYLVSIKDITELKRAQQAVEQQANYDAVTNLPNRHFFQQKLAESTQENKQSLSVFYIDLDDFKNVNDSLGHHFGDELLNAVSNRMHTILLECYLHQFQLARIGGDEFSIILYPEKQNLRVQSQDLADKLVDIVSQPYSIFGQKIEIGCSIGVALFPEQASNATQLMRHADLAMYDAKHNGKNKYVFFSEEIGHKLEQKMVLQQRIETALQKEEFILHYQPQYDLQTNNLIGLEALIRWQSDDIIYSPAEFIPFAEANGMIHLIDEYVIKTACRQIANWIEQGASVPRVAINISSQQINSSELLKVIDQQLSTYGFDGRYLELEITEYSLVEHLQVNKEQDSWLSWLRNNNIHIAIDDFGTGYSSLSYLQHMHINRLKVDRSFINNMANESESHCIVESIISLGHNVNATVLAEGIETEEQRQQLIALGCDEAQGYLMNRPLPAEDVVKLFSS